MAAPTPPTDDQRRPARSLLDDPRVPDRPSALRHALYFLTVLGGGLLLNLIVLIVASGGR